MILLHAIVKFFWSAGSRQNTPGGQLDQMWHGAAPELWLQDVELKAAAFLKEMTDKEVSCWGRHNEEETREKTSLWQEIKCELIQS